MSFFVHRARIGGLVFLLGAGAAGCSGDGPEVGSTGGSSGGASSATDGSSGGDSGSSGGVPLDAGGTSGATVGGGSSSGAGSSGTVQSGTGVVPMREKVTLDACGDTNPAGLSTDQVAALKAGGGAPPQLLYPYDGTIFPRGLDAPPVMWSAHGATAAYVHIQSELFEYSGCLPVQNEAVRIPADVWATADAQTGGNSADPFQLSVTTLAGGAVAGPATQKFIIAKGSLKGSIYYNSYNAGGLGGGGGALPGIAGQGAILRLRPGQGEGSEMFLRQGTCTGCHSLSANGERLITAELGVLNAGGLGGLLGGLGGGGAGAGQVFAIDTQTGPNPPPVRAAIGSAFGGLTPDGRYYLSSAASGLLGPLLNGGFAPPVASSILYETDTGTTLDSGVPTNAMMPTFSADGTLIAFNDHTVDGGRSLQMMDFDPATGQASNARTVFTSPDMYVGWPFITPDNRGVVFTVTTRADFGGAGWGIAPAAVAPHSDVMFLNLATGEAHLMAKAMGYATLDDAAAENTYLPFGADDLHKAYYPTISPVAAGGYFWVFFDSIRHYGNTGLRRQIWGTAIAIPSTDEFANYLPDPSAPMFYLEGQHMDEANHRAFTVLDPCKQNGESCESGVECCGGFCTDGVCGYDVPRCSEEGEACTTSDDCCDDAFSCINGFCSIVLY